MKPEWSNLCFFPFLFFELCTPFKVSKLEKLLQFSSALSLGLWSRKMHEIQKWRALFHLGGKKLFRHQEERVVPFFGVKSKCSSNRWGINMIWKLCFDDCYLYILDLRKGDEHSTTKMSLLGLEKKNEARFQNLLFWSSLLIFSSQAMFLVWIFYQFFYLAFFAYFNASQKW